jgi:pimeloyl-ACP methyl ester carboxylesterase
MMFRTRFERDLVAEFLPPARVRKRQPVILLCDGMPSIPRKQPLSEFLSQQGCWVFYPRYRGAWESGGEFLERSPHEDILAVIDGLGQPIKETAFGKTFSVRPDGIFVIGGSFGGAAAILCSLDPRVKRVVANCPVVDWAILREAKRAETSNPSYAAYIRQAFGNAYRLSSKNWRKLYSGRFYNPAYHLGELDPSKILMFHAKDDPNIPWESVAHFAAQTGIRLKLLARGGHLGTDSVVRRFWPQISRFFDLGAAAQYHLPANKPGNK